MRNTPPWGKRPSKPLSTKFFRTRTAYTVVSMAEMLDTMTSMVGMVIAVLVAIAGISLLVGGIGIMNKMCIRDRPSPFLGPSIFIHAPFRMNAAHFLQNHIGSPAFPVDRASAI